MRNSKTKKKKYMLSPNNILWYVFWASHLCMKDMEGVLEHSKAPGTFYFPNGCDESRFSTISFRTGNLTLILQPKHYLAFEQVDSQHISHQYIHKTEFIGTIRSIQIDWMVFFLDLLQIVGQHQSVIFALLVYPTEQLMFKYSYRYLCLSWR